MMMSAAAIERAAQAIHAELYPRVSWQALPWPRKREYRRLARVAITAALPHLLRCGAASSTDVERTLLRAREMLAAHQ